MIRRLSAIPIVALLMGVGSLALAQDGQGKAWIDQPLGFEVITSVPVRVTAHATHPSGVSGISLWIDGQMVSSVETEGANLETAIFEWNPPGSGTYLLEVEGNSGEGAGVPGAVEVVVDLGDLFSSTTTVGESTTEAPSSTAPGVTTTTSKPTTTTTKPTTTTTTTVCDLGVPAPSSVSGTGTMSPTLSWSYGGCREPEEFEVQVSRTPDFLRLESFGLAPGSVRSAQMTVTANCTTYYWRVRTYDAGSHGSWSAIGSFFVQITRTCA